MYYIRTEYHTQLAKMSFDKIFDLTGGVYFYFYNRKVSETRSKPKAEELVHEEDNAQREAQGKKSKGTTASCIPRPQDPTALLFNNSYLRV